MKILISIVITLALLAVITIMLIKKSVKTEDTKINWTDLASGKLSVNVSMKLLLPFKVTISNVVIDLGAAGTVYFQAKVDKLELNPGVNIFTITFKDMGKLSALGVAGLLLQKKYLNLSGTVLGLSANRTEYLN